jgi:uncharacterized membrane protein YhiD involved in acid resistance
MGDLLTGAVTTVSTPDIFIGILLTFALSLLIALVYKKTHRGLSYSQSFVFTLVIMSIIVAIVMMVIGNSLARAFGLLGAFSIIRFRTPVKDTKDTAYIFFALAIGMAAGTQNYTIAVIGTVLILGIIWLLTKMDFGSLNKHQYLLSFLMMHEEAGQGATESLFKKYLKQSMLLNINSKQDGKASEITYQVNFLDEKRRDDFVRELAGFRGIEKVHLITSKDDVEY